MGVFDGNNEVGNEAAGNKKAILAYAKSKSFKDLTKYNESFFGKLAGNDHFDKITMAVISINAIMIYHDTDYSAMFGKPEILFEGPLYFIIFEFIFVVYFTFEILVRFFGAARKTQLIHDRWFVFDFILVIIMILEIAVFSSGVVSGVKGLGNIRLLRLFRLVKLGKSIQTFMTIAHGLVASIKAAVWCVVLEFLLTIVFAIIFVQTYHNGGSLDGDEPDTAFDYFGSLDRAFYSLIIFGSFFDDLTQACDAIRDTEPGMIMISVFIVYIVLSGFIIMNMVIGILSDVVMKTSQDEKAKHENAMLGNAIKSIKDELDVDQSGGISYAEFKGIGKDDAIQSALKDLGITQEHFKKIGRLMFESATSGQNDPEKAVEMDELVETILKFQPGNDVSAFALASLDTDMKQIMNDVIGRIQGVGKLGAGLHGKTGDLGDTGKSGASGPSPARQQASEPLLPVEQETRRVSRSSDVPTSLADGRWVHVATEDLIEEIQRRLKLKDKAAEQRRALG